MSIWDSDSLMTVIEVCVVALILFLGVGFLLFRNKVQSALSMLGASEARYRSIVDELHDFIVRWQPGGTRTWANEPYCRAFGVKLEEIIGTSFFGLIDEADRERVIEELDSLTPDNPLNVDIHRVRLPNGEIGWQEWSDHAVFDKSGRTIEIQSVGRDVSARVRAEQALARSEERFRGVVESTADWVWEIDAAGFHAYSNDRLVDLLGYRPAELDGVHWHSLMHADELEAMDERLRELTRSKAGWKHWLIRMRHKDGGFRYFESSATPILDDQGELIGYRGIDRDSTLFALMNLISTKLVGCPDAEVDQRIEESLEAIGTAYGIHRIGLWWLHGSHCVRSHEWALARMDGPRRAVAFTEMVPWMAERLTRMRPVKVNRLADLPPGAEKDRDFLVSQGVQASMILPLTNEHEMIGVAVFSTVTEPKQWTDRIESELRQLTEKIVAAHSQAEATRQLIRNERDLVQSETLAHVGSFSIYPLTEDASFPDEWRAKFSREQCALFEMDAADASFETFMSRVHEEDRELVSDAIRKLFGGESEVQLQIRALTPSGRLVHIANRTQIDRDHRGRHLRIIGANRDVTGQVDRESALEKALAEIRQLRDWLEDENLRLRNEVRSIKGFEQIVGDSVPLRQCLDMASRAAPTDATILLLGETGTGKELIAKAIHELSGRRERRLVSLNCTAMPDELVESELFGHERGAFTGAHRQRAGRFELADRGTLFLDEIGDLPLHLQGKLLRVIHDGTFERVGGNETIRVNVRIIAATNRDLTQAVASGAFRADLYYRINTITIQVPPLRKRRGDIPALAQHLMEKHGPRLNPAVDSISAGTLRYLKEQDWPGNVRELENFIERSLIAARGNVLTLGAPDGNSHADEAHADDDRGEAPVELASVEREHIRRVLAQTDWVIGGAGGAASRLGLPPSTLRSRMKKLGIARHE